MKKHKTFTITITHLFLIIFLNFFNVSAQNSKLANTLLWKITGNGLQKPSYLFGTMHISNKIAFHLQDSFFTSIENADFVALELNPETWLYDMLHSSIYNEVFGLTSFSNAKNDLYKELTYMEYPGSKSFKTILADNSQLINQLLYRNTNNPLEMNYEEDTYLDLYLYQTGKKMNKKIKGLENFDISMQMLVKSMIPDERELRDQNSYYQKYKNSFSVQDRMEKAYRSGNLNEIDSLHKISSTSVNQNKYLIVERNKIMVKSMDSIMRTGSLFTGVGAAHLPGKEGIISLLSQMGYKVTPILGKETSNGRKTREKLENKLVTNKLTSYTLPFDNIEYVLPQKLSELPSEIGKQLLLFTDMANGSYYAVNKIPHFASFQGKNQNFVIQQLDSFLYESVPGKLLTKKQIVSNSGYPGFEITSRLNSGFYMQFKIFVTPVDIITFKARGPAVSYKSEQWANFFNGIKFNSTANSWDYLPVNKCGFSINVPNIHSIYTSGKETDKKVNIYAFNKTDTSFFTLNTSLLSDLNYIEDDTFELNYLCDQFSQFTLNSKLYYYQKNTPENISGTAVYKNNSNFLKTKIISIGGTYVLLSAYGKDTTQWNNYFDGFRTESNHTLKQYTYTDSTLLFNTKTDQEQLNTGESFMASIRRMLTSPVYASFFGNQNELLSKSYTSAVYPSAIFVSKQKLSPYSFYHSIDSFWIDQKTNLNKNSWDKSDIYLIQLKHQLTRLNSKTTPLNCDFLLKDSFSRQGVYIKQILQNDHLYTLQTSIDTALGLNSWQKSFIENFEAWDTCKRINILEPKTHNYLTDIITGDSVSLSTACNYFNYYDFVSNTKEITDSLLNFALSDKFGNRKVSDQLSILQVISNIKLLKPEHYLMVEKLYNRNTSNSEVQLLLLSLLVSQKSADGIQLFKKLLLSDTPLNDPNENISGIFENLEDSIELASKLYPEILNLTQLPEYKDYIIRLLAQGVVTQKISTENWISQKTQLLYSANTELKRFNNEQTNQKNSEKEENAKKLNNPDKISSTLPWKDPQGPDLLSCYTVLFSSIEGKDKNAAEFINKVIQTKHKGLIYSNSITRYHFKQPVNDSIWQWFAKNDNSKMYFCDWLEETDDTLLYPKSEYSADKMSLSWLLSISEDDKKDSLQLISKKYLINTEGSGNLYFYKYKVKNQWVLNYVGFQPADTSKMLSDFAYYSYKGIPLEKNSENDIEKQINSICKEIRLKGRKRIKFNTNDFEFNDDFD